MLARVTLFYVATFLASGAWLAVQDHTSVSPDLISFVQFAPATGVLVLLIVLGGRLRLAVSLRQPRRVALACLLTLLAAALAALVAAACSLVVGHDLHGAWDDGLPFPLWAHVAALTIGSVSEELGWRAWLQPTLESRLSVLSSSLVVGVLFGLWHIGAWAAGPTYVALFVVMATALSVVVGEIIRHAPGANLVVATVLHTAANLAMLAVLDEEDGSLAAIGCLAVGWVLTAAVTLAVGQALRPGAVTRSRRDTVVGRSVSQVSLG
uniref:CPBP family intramembrane glutamic endopeptidase n=1 Tax=Nocardioides jensenii TaxID=1843 RepID=UPI00082FC214